MYKYHIYATVAQHNGVVDHATIIAVYGYICVHLLYCLDVNECTGDHGCQHLCNNTDGSFHCYCNPGYMLHSNGINCTGWS